jgi:UDP-glucose 4-epimerase
MDEMAVATGIAFEPEVAPARPGDPARIVASGELAARDIGWTPTHSLESMIKSAFEASR